MIRGLAAVAAAATCLLAASCSTSPAGVALPRLEPGANPPGEMAIVRGRLVRSGACQAIADGGGTVVVIWPRTAQARVAGNGTTVIIWVFARTDPPIRTGDEVELTGIVMVDDLSGFARLPDDPGCRGSRYLVVRQAAASSAGVILPHLEPGAHPPGEAATLRGRLVRSGPCLAVAGNGNTVVIWPRTAQARIAGNGTTVVIWVFARSDPPIRTGEEIELTGIIMVDDISGFARLPDEPGCRTGRYLVVREARPH